jgi:hypothetical protein
MCSFVKLEDLTYFCIRATSSGYIDHVNAENAFLLLIKR